MKSDESRPGSPWRAAIQDRLLEMHPARATGGARCMRRPFPDAWYGAQPLDGIAEVARRIEEVRVCQGRGGNCRKRSSAGARQAETSIPPRQGP